MNTYPRQYGISVVRMAIPILLVVGIQCSPTESNPWVVEPSTQIGVDCIDRVSFGGFSREVIRDQVAYDSLIFRRYTKPLNEWLDRSMESALLLMRTWYSGLTDSAYAVLAYQYLISHSPFGSNIDSCQLPSIDFTQSTLLGISVNSGGCKFPEFLVRVYRAPSLKRITLKVDITEYGTCLAGFSKNIWVLVPTVPEEYEVTFEQTVVQKDPE